MVPLSLAMVCACRGLGLALRARGSAPLCCKMHSELACGGWTPPSSVMYRNEKKIASALAQSRLERGKRFIVSKGM